MKYWLIVITALSIVSCDTSKDGEDQVVEGKGNEAQVKDTADINIDKALKAVDNKELDNGIKIKWFTHGEGELVQDGDMINIDYKVYLEDGKIVDGNHIHNVPSLPFMVGFEMQTKGWDIALKELKVGDFAEIFIPSELARGEEGIEGLIPKNANNIIKIHVVEKRKPSREVDGSRIWLINENEANKELFDEGKRVLFHLLASTPSSPRFFNTELQNNPYNFGLGDQGLVPGLRKALINAKKADLMFIHVPAKEAYGSAGSGEHVKPNEDLFYRVFVMEVRDK